MVRRFGWTRLCFGLAAMLVAMPVLAVRMAPLVDYPAHLAGVHILGALLGGHAPHEVYRIQAAIIPNLAIVVAVLPLSLAGMDVELAGRLFLVAICLGVGFGARAVHAALFGRSSLVPLVGFAYAVGPILMFGFVNWLAGLAVALFGFAWWLRHRHAPGWRLAAGMVTWCAAIFVLHLMAMMLWLGLVLASEVGEPGPGWRARLAALLPALAVASVLMALSPVTTHVEGPGLLAQLAAGFGDPVQLRRRAWMAGQAMVGYSRSVDMACAGALLLGGVLALACGWLRVAWLMAVPIGGLAAAALLGPELWHGTAFIADRLPGVVLLLVIASCDLRPPPMATGIMAVGLLGLVGLRSGVATAHWMAVDRIYGQMRPALDAIPAGSRVFTVVNARGGAYGELAEPWGHFAAYAALAKPVFVADIWAEPAQSLIIRQPAYQALAELRPDGINHTEIPGGPIRSADMGADEALRHFDYVLAVRPELYQRALPPALLPVAQAGNAVLFRIRHEVAANGD